MTEQAEPHLKEVHASWRIGGKVTIVKFDLSADYSILLGETYSIPEDWTEEQAKEFREEKVEELRKAIEPHAQTEVDQLMEQSEVFN